jgi:sugar lactone lactonase YvrE
MVRNVKQAKNGDILIASYTGLWRYDGKQFTNITTAISSPSIWDVLEDQKGNLWIGTKDSGLYVYNGKSFQHYTTRQGLASNMALHLFEDKAGNIWSNAGGLSRFDGKSFKTYTTKDGLSDNSVNTFLEDKNGRIWIGTRGDACYFDGKTFTVFKNKAGKPFHNVWSIVEDQQGRIWFGAEIIKEFKNSTYYLDGAPGLWRYDGTNYTKVSERGASAIMLDKQGNIWTTGADKSIGNSTWKLLKYDQNSLSSEKPTITDLATIDRMLCRIINSEVLAAIVERLFGQPDELLGSEGDSDTRPNTDGHMIEHHRIGEGRNQLVSQRDEFVARTDQAGDGELVAANTGELTAIADQVFQSLSDNTEKFVSGAMTERVIHVLETIEVRKQHTTVASTLVRS